jgi:hypothetical protein
MFEPLDEPHASRRFDARNFLRGMTRNLRCGGRAAFFADPGAAGVAVSWSHLAVLIGLSVALLLAEQMAQVGLNGTFNANGLPYALFTVPLVLLTSWAWQFWRRATRHWLMVVT